MSNSRIKLLLKKRVVLLDGATGTELHKRGMPQGVCPESWCLKNPELTKSVHSDYLKAGSDIVYACTFGANRLKLSHFKIKDVVSVNRRLALLARQAVGKKALVAGDIATTGEFIKPFGSLDFNQAVDIYKEQVKGLLLGGVDLFAIETMIDIQEARAALIAVKELTNKFTIVTMTYESGGRTLNGNDPVSALITLQSLGADAIGCNCSSGPQAMVKIISKMRPYSTVPLVAKPNAGMPKLINNKAVFNMKPGDFADSAKKLITAGATIIGGCCGTTPEHIFKLKKVALRSKPVFPKRKKIAALSSARGVFIFEKEKFPIVVGEKINPTGKKTMQAELLQNKYTQIRTFAKAQEAQGAKLLDVNLGAPRVDEKKAMLEVISLLPLATSLPLVIDSANPEVIEQALRFYPGRALINSISGESRKLKKLLNIAKKYGAMFIILPLAGKKLPKTFKERKPIIEAVFKAAKKIGFSKEDILIDGLVMPLSWNAQAAGEVFKTISWCTRSFKAKTIVGLSNISFGLPQRHLINKVFLKLAGIKGLTLAIADPEDSPGLRNKLAEDLLFNKPKASEKFIAAYAKQKESTFSKRISKKKLSPCDYVSIAIIEGDRSQIEEFIQKALESGETPSKLIEQVMTPAIIKVGNLFDRKEYFLPQLIASAEAMKKGVSRLEPYLKNQKLAWAKKGVIILATVKGDVHDIGKNIVALMLKNHGFKIIDLGKDISTKKIIQNIKIYSPDIVGLSALMTTTMINMDEVVKSAEREGLKCKFMIGGAVVNKAYADSIGAKYAKDGVEAVRVAEKLDNKSAPKR
ncbi:MAG: homocysteine S-methyltransferase family protein [Candidatus Omnitrophica bacterium]|nr:homocysteine S-methyltransferase family protein [Candidatus Omnitrophota bacterium]